MKDNRVGLGLIKKRVTMEDLKRYFPKKANTINEKTLEMINSTIDDPEFNGHSLMDTILNFENCMYKHKARLSDYINAIRFCAYLESEDDFTVRAYIKTFRNRDFVIKRMDLDKDNMKYKELCSAASRYRKSPLVTEILAQADVPLYLMFQGARYKAVNVLIDRALYSKLDRDRIAAADKFLTHVKPPENTKMEIDIGLKDGNIIDDYEKVIAKMVEEQKNLIKQGANVKEIANTSIKVKDSDIIDAVAE